MPSDESVRQVLEVFKPARAAFRRAVSGTVDQVRSYLADHAVQNDGRAQRTSVELGRFAKGRIDFDRFASLFADRQAIDPVTFETMEHALTTLSNISTHEDNLFVTDVPSGGDLQGSVQRALEEIGRAFGAARVFELSRTGQYRYSNHARSLGSFPFARWSRNERRLAPPLIVLVDGCDLHATSLAGFLDGSMKFVLVVRGPSAPAPLARLITPRTFVVQSSTTAALERFAAFEGPGVAAIVPETAAEFVHDPEAGAELWARLSITRRPHAPKQSLGGLSVAQQLEELRHLEAMAASPPSASAATMAASVAEPPAVAAPAAPADPVDKLAAWLLQQADLRDIE